MEQGLTFSGQNGTPRVNKKILDSIRHSWFVPKMSGPGLEEKYNSPVAQKLQKPEKTAYGQNELST